MSFSFTLIFLTVRLIEIQFFFLWRFSEVPNSPNQARVEVVGEHSAHIWWLQPEVDSGGICTKFKGKEKKFIGKRRNRFYISICFAFLSQFNGRLIPISPSPVANWRCATQSGSGVEATISTKSTLPSRIARRTLGATFEWPPATCRDTGRSKPLSPHLSCYQVSFELPHRA